MYTVTSIYFLYITIWTQNLEENLYLKKENMYELEDNLQIIILDIYSVDKEYNFKDLENKSCSC